MITSPYYSAPEFNSTELFTEKLDIWALGCIMQEICTLKLNNVVDSAQRNIKGKISAIPDMYPTELNDLCVSCLNPDPTLRPAAS